MTNALIIFDYSDYRTYIQDWIKYSKTIHSMNLSRLARAIGVHTSYLSHVLAGSKNLSFEQAVELSEIMQLTNQEKEFLFTLIQIERAGSKKLKNYWEEKQAKILEERSKVQSRVGDHHILSTENKAIFYSNWIYVAIYITTSINNGQTLDEIAERFTLTRIQAEEILNFLIETGICNKVSNKFTMGKSIIFLENTSPLVVKHHINWRLQAMQKMDSRTPTELFYTSPMSMSKTDFLKIRELLSASIEASLKICRDSPAEELCCLNIDLFKLRTN